MKSLIPLKGELVGGGEERATESHRDKKGGARLMPVVARAHATVRHRIEGRETQWIQREEKRRIGVEHR